MTQAFEDFNSIEKICRLPEEFAMDGVERGVDPDVADVTLYVPWNTLVFYYEDYGYNSDLIPVGHTETGMELLENMGESFSVMMEPVSEEEPTKENSTAITVITMTVGDTIITAELSDSETTRAFLETLPCTFTMKLSITMGETTIYADLYDTELTDEFLAQLPQTISMQRVGGGREFYGSLESSLNYNEEDSQTTFENGDIAYWYSGNGLCLLYDNQVEEPEIDSGIIVFGKITSDLSVFSELDDNIEVRVEVYAE